MAIPSLATDPLSARVGTFVQNVLRGRVSQLRIGIFQAACGLFGPKRPAPATCHSSGTSVLKTECQARAGPRPRASAASALFLGGAGAG